LGDGADHLKEKINAAISEVGKAAADVNAIEGARNAVADVVTAVGSSGSTGDDTIAGMMKAIAEPFKDIDTNLCQVITKVAALATAVTDANTLAQSIRKDDATTWDNVKALANALSKLRKAVEDTETARSGVKIKLEKLDAQQTLALREVQSKVKNLSTVDAKEKAEASEKAFKGEADNVALSAGTSELNEAKKKVDPAVTAAESLAAMANAAAEKAMRIVLPLRLTEGILEVMLCAMKCDPNIHYLRRYWQVQVEKIKKVCEKLKQADVLE
jgi:chromosome segregation ATPase